MSGGQIDLLGAPDVGGDRSELDTYDTPVWATYALVDYLGLRLLRGGFVWEPCGGAGAIVDGLTPFADDIVATDVAPRRVDVRKADFLRESEPPRYVPAGPPLAWIITNPPYTLPDGTTAADFWRHACSLCDRVAMLLRVGWLEPCEERETLFEGNRPLTDLVVLPRVSFIGAPPGNNQTSCWYISDLVDPPPRGMVRMRRYTAEIRKPSYWSR